MTRDLAELVRRRAADRCEYCQLSQSQHTWRFEVEHVIPRQHRGAEEPENLALSCPKCNRHKGPNLSGIDPDSGKIESLFNPRQQRWGEHFRWDGPRLVGLTPSARATIVVLNMNDPVRIAVRMSLIEEGDFPPVS